MKATDVNLLDGSQEAVDSLLPVAQVNAAALFEKFTQSLRERLGEEVFSSWFGRLKLESISDKSVRLSVPTAFLRAWINSNYLALLQELWHEVLGSSATVEVLVRSAARGAKAAIPVAKAADETLSKVMASKKPIASIPTSTEPSSVASAIFQGSPLDPKYTFTNFIEGTSNRLALAAARTVAEAGTGALRFNPLFIHAAVGLGKTHLLQAIANSMASRSLPIQVIYFTAEYFMWRFAMALRDNSALALKEELRNIDLLIIDDLQFLQGKSIQNEFCHLLNLLLNSAKQVVVAADRPITELDMLDDRVKSRLQGGVALEISNPDYQMRLQMLQHRLEAALKEDPQLALDEHVLTFVASAISGSGRDIEGAFNQLLVCQSFGGDLSIPRVGELISHLMRPKETKRVKIEEVQRIVSRHFNVSKQDLLSNRRTRSIVKPRQIAMYLSKVLTPRSLPEIGRRFGGRDHTTVLHAVRKIELLLEQDTQLAQDIETLKQFIQEQGS